MKKPNLLLPSIAILLLSCTSSFAQKSQWPNTLLWEITGKGLQKPSYLFGTMHLQDKRIFNMGDSLYYYLDKAEGFANEVSFNEYIDSVMKKTFQRAEDKYMHDDITEAVIDTAVVSIDATKNDPYKKQMDKWVRKIRNERLKEVMKYGEMPTILDAYLYGIAMKKGKWLGAVEEVKDQLYLMDEIGKDVEEEEFKQSTDKSLKGIESLLSIYLAEDLGKIDQYISGHSTSRAKTLIFHNRNVVMSKSIDSLSHLRSMFYAVGAGHLPGDSGVITLLRNQGYTLTPIITTKKIAAEKYAEKLPPLSWYEVQQANGSYSIEMPGIPTEHSIFGEMAKMKVFLDITNMNFYMMGHTIAQFEESELESALKKRALSMNKNGYIENKRKINRDGLKGIEGIISNGALSFRIQLLLKDNVSYFILLGGQAKNTLLDKYSDRYFNSFKIGKSMAAIAPDEWKEFTIPGKGFTIKIPDVPKKNPALEKQADGTDWTYTVYDHSDFTTGLYFILQVRDIKAGFFFENDSAFFENTITGMEDVETVISNRQLFAFEGFPAQDFEAENKKEAMSFRMRNVTRGNRIYTLMVIGNKSKMTNPAIEKYFNSLHLTPYEDEALIEHSSVDGTFRSTTAQSFELQPQGDDSTRTHNVSFNPQTLISYEVLKDRFSPFYWAKNDSSFYVGQLSNLYDYRDSLLYKKEIKNGRLKGYELLIQSPGSNNLKKTRSFLHADTLYTLLALIPSQYINEKANNDFFEKFAVLNDQENKHSIFTGKAVALIEGLKSQDSITFTKALGALNNAYFTKADLPVLHNALLYKFPDDSLGYYGAKTTLISRMSDIVDSTTVEFIKLNYDKPFNTDDDKVKFLNILVDYKSAYSYSLLKDLIINKTPKNPVKEQLSYLLFDSVQLFKTLYPEFLTLIHHPKFWQPVCDNSLMLLDSSLLTVDDLKPYEKAMIHIADTVLNGNTMEDADFESWQYASLLNLLGKINSKESSTTLKRFVLAPDLLLKKTAVIDLLKNKQPVDIKQIEIIAAEKKYRLELYEDLKLITQEKLFPTKYLTQQYFAESVLYDYLTEDDGEPDEIVFVAMKEELFAGKKKRFFVFKVRFKLEDGGDESYLAFAGPYSLDSKDLETSYDVVVVEYDTQFDKKTINTQLKKYIQQGEEYFKTRESNTEE